MPEYAGFRTAGNDSNSSTSTDQRGGDLRQYAVTVTSYNPEHGQTDTSPCIAAGGQDICELAREGQRVIAVSRDLRQHFLEKSGKFYKYPAQVYIESDNPSIAGCAMIYDTMNARYTNRIDLFYLTRAENQGGKAVISNKTEYCNK